jgi:hypothetical protein
LIEEKRSVFKKNKTAAIIIEEFLQSKLARNNLTVAVSERPSKQKFWSVVDKAKHVYQLTFTINQLNIGEGDSGIREQLDRINKELNDDEVKLAFNNTQGNLNVKNQIVKDLIAYVSQVGGAFELAYKKTLSSAKHFFRSSQATKKTHLNADISTVKDNQIIDKIKKADEEDNE